ncbi:MAG: hypothetical protein KAQ98_06880 [Bacteriovoracaceae bacterium]|nr:hypothetical protein [Bacteriovoracaceae bacterium]
MNKSGLKLNSWLDILGGSDTITSCKTSTDTATTTAPHPPCDMKNMLLENFLVSGWKGESLISKSALNIKNIINELIPDAQKLFQTADGLNRSLKLAIFNEFASYVKDHPSKNGTPENYLEFWKNIRCKNSPYEEYLKEFITVYSFRAVIIYLFKIRFIVKLCEALDITPEEKDLLNPNSFFHRKFKKNSSTELMCESLQVNQYSWYRPSEPYRNKISKLAHNFHLISITEMMKICTYNQTDKFKDQNYSHTFSQKNFGLFLNTLFIFLPYWLNNKNYPKTLKQNSIPDILSCKFTGNWLTSLTLSHWVAQEQNIQEKWNLWSELICPNFVGNKFTDGTFVKLCHELQFLTFMVQIAIRKNMPAQNFICKVMKEKYKLAAEDVWNGQMTMFSNQEETNTELLYDRTFLNLTDLPKTNPHHFVLSKIQSEFKTLKDYGYLLLMTNQNLLVPSQSEKIKQLLEEFKIVTNFNFENLKGKGKIPSNLYVLTRRNSNSTKKNGLNKFCEYLPSTRKDVCHTFRFNGELASFHNFSVIAHEIEKFFINTKSNSTPPIFQREFSENISLEFYQDAIVDGKLLHSSSDNQGHITHPSFFKNLISSCIYFNHFFKIENINDSRHVDSNKDSLTSGFLGVNLRKEEKYPIILIVNVTDPLQIKLEMIQSSSFQATLEEYGTAFFHYYGLIPKTMDINIDLFREFFNSPIGRQIIQLSLTGFTKIKSKLKTLLIPKFFSLPTMIPGEQSKQLSIFQMKPEELKASHPEVIENVFNTTLNTIEVLKSRYPFYVASKLLSFKHTISKIIEDFKDHTKDHVDYQNPIILEPVLKLETHNIYPNNPEIYIDFNISNPKKLKQSMSESILRNNTETPYIELWSKEQVLVKIFSEPEILNFIHFILSSTHGTPISTILQHLSIPRIEELKSVINNYRFMKSTINNLHKKTTELISSIITEQISFQDK